VKENERPKLQIFKWSNDLLTNFKVVDKKEKSTKKEKNQQQQKSLIVIEKVNLFQSSSDQEPET